MQPKARITSEWPPSCVVSDDTAWDVLRRVGTTGFIIVMMTLSWWGKAAMGVDDTSFQVAVAEVNWVLEKMIQGGIVLVTKRPAELESDGDERALKR